MSQDLTHSTFVLVQSSSRISIPFLTHFFLFTKLLCWGGSTAVGHHVVQLAKLSGYTVFTTASPQNHAALEALGADKCFNYKDADVVEQIKKAAGDKGVFAAVDTACEQGSTDSCVGESFIRPCLPLSDLID